jgi:hypothetical protein
MPADEAELLERAERLRPDREEVLRELEEALDQMDALFPEGEPSRATPEYDQYVGLLLQVSGAKLELAMLGSQPTAKPRRAQLHVLPGGRDDA